MTEVAIKRPPTRYDLTDLTEAEFSLILILAANMRREWEQLLLGSLKPHGARTLAELYRKMVGALNESGELYDRAMACEIKLEVLQ